MALPTLSARVHSIWTRDAACDRDENRATVFRRERCLHGTYVQDPVGLPDSFTWHRRHQTSSGNGERAVLAQTREHYRELRAKFPATAHTLDEEAASGFGEQLVLEGLSSDTVCVGDVFQSSQGEVRLQVTCPRLACVRVDRKHPLGLRTGTPGTVRQFVSANGRGGIFFRVLAPGFIGDGDEFTLVHQPLPHWTLAGLSQLCYPESPFGVTFRGTATELAELCALEELAGYEWRAELLAEAKACRKAEEERRQPSDAAL